MYVQRENNRKNVNAKVLSMEARNAHLQAFT